MQHGSKDQRDLALFALEAVALDTETTGLDPRKARLIEIGGVVLAPGGGETDETFETFVNAGQVPAEAARITGIDTDMLADAPAFPDALRALQDFVAGRVVIGHSFGFDLAVMAQECRSHGLPQWSPLALDTRFLAQVAFPNLPGYTLETIAARCGVELGARHRALGDAVSCARIFGALAPHLRERGVRTLGEALAATRRFEDDQAYPSMWEPLSGGLQGAAARAQNLDPFLFSRRVSDVMTRLPKFIAREASVADAAQIMARDKVGSLFVGASDALSRDLGILTERDVLGIIAREGAAGLARPVDDFASRPLQSVAAPAFVYRAVGRMTRLGVRHLGVMDDAGRIIGAISARDLLKSRMSEPVALGDAIDTAPDVVQLGKAWGTIPAVARALLANELDGRQIAAVVAREVAALTRRADAARGADGAGAAREGGRGRAAVRLRNHDFRLGGARGKPAGVRPGQCARVCARRRGRAGGTWRARRSPPRTLPARRRESMRTRGRRRGLEGRRRCTRSRSWPSGCRGR